MRLLGSSEEQRWVNARAFDIQSTPGRQTLFYHVKAIYALFFFYRFIHMYGNRREKENQTNVLHVGEKRLQNFQPSIIPGYSTCREKEHEMYWHGCDLDHIHVSEIEMEPVPLRHMH